MMFVISFLEELGMFQINVQVPFLKLEASMKEVLATAVRR